MNRTTQQAAATPLCQGLPALHAAARGTGMVRGVDVGVGATTFTLRYPTCELAVYLPVAPAISDYDRPEDLLNPIAVRVTHGPDEVTCRLLGTGRRGPVRYDISLGQALAYADVGIHTIFLAA